MYFTLLDYLSEMLTIALCDLPIVCLLFIFSVAEVHNLNVTWFFLTYSYLVCVS